MADSDIRRLSRHARRAAAFPPNARCTACGERNPVTLVVGSNPTCCYRCAARTAGRMTVEAHHWAGQQNAPDTILVDANDHRELSDMQQDWPEETLRNPNQTPLRTAAAVVRGWLDDLRLMITKVVNVIALLERGDRWFTEKYGPSYREHPECAWLFEGLAL
jgi:hypothetical protein